MNLITVKLSSTQMTLQSIQLCCENSSLADAHTLIRKYRDDLYFYLYILYVNSNMDILNNNEITRHEKNIVNWNNNNLKDINITEILKYIGESSIAKEAVNKYKLKKSFSKISNDLNDFVHSNGRLYYNRTYQYYYNVKSIKENVDKIKYEINYITSTFLFLLILIRPDYISSTDYVDYLEYGLEPIEGSQYWVAGFVNDYINKNMLLICDEWKDYLREQVDMNI